MISIDYSKYSTIELLDVKKNIDPNSANYEALSIELSERKNEIHYMRENEKVAAYSLAESRVKLIGYFQIAAAVTILLYYFISISGDSVSLLSTISALATVILNAVAGFTCIKEKHEYYWLSVLNQGLQIPSISLGAISATYSGLGGAYVYISWNTEFLFGATALFSPGFSFVQYTSNLPTQSISIDVLAVIFIGALLTVSDTQRQN